MGIMGYWGHVVVISPENKESNGKEHGKEPETGIT